jgi:hypothetical protein
MCQKAFSGGVWDGALRAFMRGDLVQGLSLTCYNPRSKTRSSALARFITVYISHSAAKNHMYVYG